MMICFIFYLDFLPRIPIRDLAYLNFLLRKIFNDDNPPPQPPTKKHTHTHTLTQDFSKELTNNINIRKRLNSLQKDTLIAILSQVAMSRELCLEDGFLLHLNRQHPIKHVTTD